MEYMELVYEENSIYSIEGSNQELDDDEISTSEAAFMQGYNEAFESEEN